MSKSIFLYFLYFFTGKKSTENPENIFYVNIVFRMATKCVCIMYWHYAAYQNDSNLGEGIKPPLCTSVYRGNIFHNSCLSISIKTSCFFLDLLTLIHANMSKEHNLKISPLKALYLTCDPNSCVECVLLHTLAILEWSYRVKAFH